ncbi:uncharacterized protein J8A68_004480 [[Candida] subhashii]|uniref:Uncharacterized protein n=1 Tax=[Candida] subhashii TaxID=561895 RepID=A0A8J5QJ29_9ASCO|nr:uncharacterized protein J8A68_004480 [[Candida] subhashii]KAG7661980.1 hypothetical protein J8A68_004480 [[Candida] subhashii]
MSEKKISRSHLYNDSQSEYESDSESIGYVAPNIDFEFVEVDVETPEPNAEEEKESIEEEEHEHKEVKEDKQEDDEFEFPLFFMGAVGKPTAGGETEEVSKAATMKVSLKEEEVEEIKQERPESYYFANYTDEQRHQFEICAITSDDIYKQLEVKTIDSQPWKCIDLTKYNAKIESRIQRDKIRKNKLRPGKKKRTSKIECRERRIERKKLEKKLEQEKKKLIKKMFHKRGGKKNKKKLAASSASAQAAPSKPKYRTE